MAIATRVLAVTLIVFIVLIVGGVLLQIFLSRRRSRWPGLVLPGLTFLYSILMVLSVAVYGRVGESGFPWGPVLYSLILGNLPTLVLLAIYWAARERYRTRDQMDKMKIDDL